MVLCLWCYLSLYFPEAEEEIESVNVALAPKQNPRGFIIMENRNCWAIAKWKKLKLNSKNGFRKNENSTFGGKYIEMFIYTTFM